MPLTEKGCEHLQALTAQQQAIHEFIFAEIGDAELKQLSIKLSALRGRIEKAPFKVAADLM